MLNTRFALFISLYACSYLLNVKLYDIKSPNQQHILNALTG